MNGKFLSSVFLLFHSHLLSRCLGAGLVVVLFYYDTNLLAEYSILFSSTQVIGLVFKAGFSQKVYRDTVENELLGGNTLKKFNTFYYIFVLLVSVYIYFYELNYVLIASLLLAFSSVRCAHLLGCGQVRTSIFLEYSLPIISIIFVILTGLVDEIELIIMLGYVPSVLFLVLKNKDFDFYTVMSNNFNDYKSSFYFLYSAVIQQLNTHLTILLFGSGFSNEIVSSVRMSQVIATPLQLLNVSFATNFQRIAKGEPEYENVKYEAQYMLLALSVTGIMNAITLIIIPNFIDISDELVMSFKFFAFFSLLYFLRVFLKFSDTRLIIRRKENLIFLFNLFISILCLFGGFLFTSNALAYPAFIMFNSVPLFLGICSFLHIRYFQAHV